MITIPIVIVAPVAHWLEQRSYKAWVGGSIPPRRTKGSRRGNIKNHLLKMVFYIKVLLRFV